MLKFTKLYFLIALSALLPAAISARTTDVSASAELTVDAGYAGTVKGSVLDAAGAPIADATVALFRVGTSQVLKQVSTAADGSFVTKILPGKYTILAVAQGFNPVTIASVEVARSAELVYGFKLQRAGSGNTLPEKRLDKNSAKWRIRAAQVQRSIYQNNDNNDESSSAVAEVGAEQFRTDDDRPERKDLGQNTVIQSYFGSAGGEAISGVNFARYIPISDRAELIVAGQVAKGRGAPQRFEADVRYSVNDSHRLNLKASAARLGRVKRDRDQAELGQFSVQALDQWRVKNGVILVLGFDAAKFVGAGDDLAITPRFGFQYDVDAKTRFRAAYTSTAVTEQRNWNDVADLEGGSFYFTEPVAVQDLVVKNKMPKLGRSSRLEFGIERVLDNSSSIEGTAFVDTSVARGVGIEALPLDDLSAGGTEHFTGENNGRSAGFRLVYTRRLSGVFSTAAGYSYGTAAKLNERALTDPEHLVEGGTYQSIFARLDADLRSGTSVSTVYRLSSDATVFAIDPFKGQLAIYDPGLSVYISQRLPTLGLPIRAKAIIDARNVLNFQDFVGTSDGLFRLADQGLVLRGGIQLRF